MDDVANILDDADSSTVQDDAHTSAYNAEETAQLDESVADHPPSVKLTYFVMKQYGAMTQEQLGAETLLPARTVRYALNRLEADDVVTEDVYIGDARKHVYDLNLPEDGASYE